MLSDKAKAAVDKIRTLDAEDVKSLSEAIKAEVDHAAEKVTAAARAAEAKARKFAEDAQEKSDRVVQDARQQIEDHPIPTVLVALGAGFLIGMLMGGSRRD